MGIYTLLGIILSRIRVQVGDEDGREPYKTNLQYLHHAFNERGTFIQCHWFFRFQPKKLD